MLVHPAHRDEGGIHGAEEWRCSSCNGILRKQGEEPGTSLREGDVEGEIQETAGQEIASRRVDVEGEGEGKRILGVAPSVQKQKQMKQEETREVTDCQHPYSFL